MGAIIAEMNAKNHAGLASMNTARHLNVQTEDTSRAVVEYHLRHAVISSGIGPGLIVLATSCWITSVRKYQGFSSKLPIILIIVYLGLMLLLA